MGRRAGPGCRAACRRARPAPPRKLGRHRDPPSPQIAVSQPHGLSVPHPPAHPAQTQYRALPQHPRPCTRPSGRAVAAATWPPAPGSGSAGATARTRTAKLAPAPRTLKPQTSSCRRARRRPRPAGFRARSTGVNGDGRRCEQEALELGHLEALAGTNEALDTWCEWCVCVCVNRNHWPGPMRRSTPGASQRRTARCRSGSSRRPP
eukprot:scaffold3649_cov108-Isochrysis_galbana.AAC.1